MSAWSFQRSTRCLQLTQDVNRVNPDVYQMLTVTSDGTPDFNVVSPDVSLVSPGVGLFTPDVNQTLPWLLQRLARR